MAAVLDEVRLSCLTTVCCLCITSAAVVTRDCKGQGKMGNELNKAVITAVGSSFFLAAKVIVRSPER